MMSNDVELLDIKSVRSYKTASDSGNDFPKCKKPTEGDPAGSLNMTAFLTISLVAHFLD